MFSDSLIGDYNVVHVVQDCQALF